MKPADSSEPTRSELFSLVLSAAIAAQKLQVLDAIREEAKTLGLPCAASFERWQPAPDGHLLHARWAVLEDLRLTLETLGRIHRRFGLDPAEVAPIWGQVCALEQWTVKFHYERIYEWGREVNVERFTPKAVHDGLLRRNRLRYAGWELFCQGDLTSDDGYGQDISAVRAVVVSPKGERTEYHLHEYNAWSEATDIFRHVMGFEYLRTEDMERDPPHPAEGGFGANDPREDEDADRRNARAYYNPGFAVLEKLVREASAEWDRKCPGPHEGLLIETWYFLRTIVRSMRGNFGGSFPKVAAEGITPISGGATNSTSSPTLPRFRMNSGMNS